MEEHTRTASYLIDPFSQSLIQHLEAPILPFELVWVQGGTFTIGSEEEEADDWEKPLREVRVFDYYLGRNLVSQELWEAVMEDRPSRFKGNHRPVEKVSWEDCQEFLKRLSSRTGLSYRLPSEAEWEYAARGGRYSHKTPYAGSRILAEVGWYETNSSGQTHPVGLKQGNELGIHDLSGHLYEWCQDAWHNSHEGRPPDSGPWQSADSVAFRVFRGGSWLSVPQHCRVSSRFVNHPRFRDSGLGFRLALSPQSVG